MQTFTTCLLTSESLTTRKIPDPARPIFISHIEWKASFVDHHVWAVQNNLEGTSSIGIFAVWKFLSNIAFFRYNTKLTNNVISAWVQHFDCPGVLFPFQFWSRQDHQCWWWRNRSVWNLQHGNQWESITILRYDIVPYRSPGPAPTASASGSNWLYVWGWCRP
jgi:hypothetical protein